MRTVIVLTLAMSLCSALHAGPLRARLAERRAQAQGEQQGEHRSALPAGVIAVRDVAYGSDPRQRFDVYRPAAAHGAPVLFMVHGGGWRIGDKSNAGFLDNKLGHWAARGFVVIAVGYRMLPDADVPTQVRDIAAALAAAQRDAASWGGDPALFVLLGHSAGAHLVSLLASAPALAGEARPWLGTVALDSAAFDIERIMEHRHLPLYDAAFGADPARWRALSPYAQLNAAGKPLFAVCSSQREDSCAQAQRYSAKALGLGMRVEVRPEDLTHKQINESLGLDSDYTRAVDAFLRSLHPALARLLP